MQNIYKDGTYLKYNPNWHVEESEWKTAHVINFIRKHNLNPTSICEVGCGCGEILRQLSNRLEGDIRFAGYEISPDAFKICSKKSSSNLSFYLKDFLEEEVIFDLVMALDVVEHVEDYFNFLRRLRSKGKYKLFHIPLALSAQSVLRGTQIIRDRRIVGHIHCFTKEMALAALEDTDYEILDWSYIGKRVERRNLGDWKPSVLRLPRKVLFSLNKDFAVRLLGGYSISVLAR